MGIAGAIMVPHPPLIIPAVGRGEEAVIEQASEIPSEEQPEQEDPAQEQASSGSPAQRSKLQEEITQLQTTGLTDAAESVSK